MTVGTSTSRFDSTADFEGQQAPMDAAHMALAIKDRWAAGEESPNVAASLASHPELQSFRSVVLDLAYQEYRFRLEAGEDLDADEFSRRFPSLQRSLYMLIEMHSLLEQDPDFRSLQQTLCWPEPGKPFLQFVLLAEIGRGTFGRVFLAREPALGNRRVVVKVAPCGGEEAEILGRLRHPNIVPIYSLQEDEETGLAAFCMPYLGRATLCDVLVYALAGKRPPTQARAILDAVATVNKDAEPAESLRPDALLRTTGYVNGALHIGAQLADALDHSHRRGIYHRDLKPSNVLVTSEGRPLLLDFNLSVDAALQTRKIGGTIPYMAPEELAPLFAKKTLFPSRHYDPRSDVFSLGVMLYELLTGRLPFGSIPTKPTIEELARHMYQRQRKGPLAIQTLNRHVDARLAALIERCLAFEPDQRPETAQELAAALRKELRPIRRIRRWVRNHRKSMVSAAMMFVASILFVVLFFALRPPYSQRQLQRGLRCVQESQFVQAIDYLNASIEADPLLSKALFARAEANQRLERFERAQHDYNRAYQLTHNPVAKACEGYCLDRLRYRREAIAAYRIALNEGYKRPALLYNNIGFSSLALGQEREAIGALQRALEIDDRLQAAHVDLIAVHIRAALHGQPIPTVAFASATKAIEIGPCTADLYHDVTALYALAAKQDHALAPVAIEYAAKAIELGLSPKVFISDAKFSELHKEPAFLAVMKLTTSVSDPPKSVRLLDPLAGR
jgi:eukaryotic-like serine/threonine-protein kinase